MKARILVIEDSADYQLMIEESLKSHYDLDFASNGSQALKTLNENSYNLFLVDIVLPDMSGLQICSYIKSQDSLKNTPLILLTSKDTVEDKVKGLDSGADDYIVKPFDFKELDARIRSHLRRTSDGSQKQSIFLGSLELILDKQIVRKVKDNQTVDVTPIEFKLLICFARRVDFVLSRQQILDLVWPNNLNVTERTVDSHVSNLRKKIVGMGVEISAVHGSGYRLTIISD